MPVRYSEHSAGPSTRRATPDAPPALASYEGWTKNELVEELVKRGFSKAGSKAVLIARLEEDDG